ARRARLARPTVRDRSIVAPMKIRRIGMGIAAGALLAGLVSAAHGVEVRKRYRLVRASDDKSKQQPPAAFTASPSTCEPDLGLVTGRLSPDVLGETFDPALFHEVSVTRSGRMLAYATSVTEEGAPGPPQEVVL